MVDLFIESEPKHSIREGWDKKTYHTDEKDKDYTNQFITHCKGTQTQVYRSNASLVWWLKFLSFCLL